MFVGGKSTKCRENNLEGMGDGKFSLERASQSKVSVRPLSIGKSKCSEIYCLIDINEK